MKTKNILIVDDLEVNIEILRQLLHHDYNCIVAYNGLESITKFKENEIDLVLMDIMMPIMGGIEACQKIKEIRQVPIFAVTAHSYSEQDLLNKGFDHVIKKPISFLELKNKIKKVL